MNLSGCAGQPDNRYFRPLGNGGIRQKKVIRSLISHHCSAEGLKNRQERDFSERWWPTTANRKIRILREELFYLLLFSLLICIFCFIFPFNSFF